jgi:sensor domain CHASE-containing protein
MTNVRVVLELEQGERIAGWVVPASRPRERFDGLLELITAVDRLRATAGGGEPDRSEDSVR